MLARIAVHLPESLWLRQSAALQSFTVHFRGEQILVHPPRQSLFEVRPDDHGNFNVNEIYQMLTPVSEERVYPFVRMDGEFVKHANLLLLDFVRSEFNRAAGHAPDPASEVIEAAVGNIVARLRYTIGAPPFREFRLMETFWTVRYFDDTGDELPEVKGLVRGRVNAPFRFRFTGLDASSWSAVQNLSFDFQPHIWERLYLDAQFLLPEVGPALTLAISAIETAANQMIHDLLPGKAEEAERLISAKKLGQRLDSVAKKLVGISLKEDGVLWEAFHRLRRARNAAAHEGTPLVDGTVVTDQVAQTMILAIRPVLDWLEARMLPAHRNHRDPHEPKWEWRPPLQSGEEPKSIDS